MRHYTRKKIPVKYIFKKAIPADNIKKIGEADTGIILENENMINWDMYNSINSLQILKDLFINTPEKKGIELLEKSVIKFKNLLRLSD